MPFYKNSYALQFCVQDDLDGIRKRVPLFAAFQAELSCILCVSRNLGVWLNFFLVIRQQRFIVPQLNGGHDLKFQSCALIFHLERQIGIKKTDWPLFLLKGLFLI